MAYCESPLPLAAALDMRTQRPIQRDVKELMVQEVERLHHDVARLLRESSELKSHAVGKSTSRRLVPAAGPQLVVRSSPVSSNQTGSESRSPRCLPVGAISGISRTIISAGAPLQGDSVVHANLPRVRRRLPDPSSPAENQSPSRRPRLPRKSVRPFGGGSRS